MRFIANVAPHLPPPGRQVERRKSNRTNGKRGRRLGAGVWLAIAPPYRCLRVGLNDVAPVNIAHLMLHNWHPHPYPIPVCYLDQSLITLADKLHSLLAVVLRKSLRLAHKPLQSFAWALRLVLLDGLSAVGKIHNDGKKAHAI